MNEMMIGLLVAVGVIVGMLTGATIESKQARHLQENCQQELPRTQKCVMQFVPEIKEK